MFCLNTSLSERGEVWGNGCPYSRTRETVVPYLPDICPIRAIRVRNRCENNPKNCHTFNEKRGLLCIPSPSAINVIIAVIDVFDAIVGPAIQVVVLR